MLSGSGIGSLGVGVGVDPFLGGSFGGMPDFGPMGIGGALGVPMGVDFNVNLGNASNLDLLNRVAAAVNERYPTQTSDPAPTPTVAPTSQPAPAVGTQYTGIAAQELTGDPDMDRQILDARARQDYRSNQARTQERIASGELPSDFVYGMPGGKPGVLEIGINSEGVKGPNYQQIAYSTPEEYRKAYNLKLQTESPRESWTMNLRPEIKALIAAGLTPFIPGAAAGLAGTLGIGGALGSAAVGSALGAGAAAITDQDIAKGALTGALGGFGKGALDTGGTLGLGQSGSGVASLADTARVGAEVSDKVGGIETLGDLAKIARTGYDIYKDYEDAKRPGYTPDLPGQIDVVDLETGAMGPPAAPGVEVDKPVFPDIDEEKTTQPQPGGSEGSGGGGGQTESGGEETTTVEVDDETSTSTITEGQDGTVTVDTGQGAAEAVSEAEDGTVTVEPEGQGETGSVSEAEDGTVTVEPDGQPAADGQDGAATDAGAEGGDETVVVDVEDRYAGTPYEGRSEGLILDGWLPNGPWRYEGGGIFRDLNTGEVLYDATLPEDIRVGDRFDRGQANDATETVVDAGDTQEATTEDTGESGDEETVTIDIPVIPPGGTGGADTSAPEGGEEETITVNIPETPTGGTETGGTETGGTEAGGGETGGTETGGTEAGGTETGGAETGGAETGGTETGGGETGGGETGGADGEGGSGDGTGEGSGDGEVKVGDGQLDGEGEGSGTSTGEGTGTGTGPGTGDGTGGGTGTGTGTGTGSGSGTGTGTGSGSGTGSGGGGQQPSGGGIQSLLPLLGMFLLGQQLLGGSGSSPRGRVPLEQESATGYYNIDREVRRRMGLGG